VTFQDRDELVFERLLAIVGVWFAYASNRARSQKRAIDEVQRLGGSLGFDYKFDADMK